jgi:hypothetical protein
VPGDAFVVLLLARRHDDLVATAARASGDELDERHPGDRQQRLAG